MMKKSIVLLKPLNIEAPQWSKFIDEENGSCFYVASNWNVSTQQRECIVNYDSPENLISNIHDSLFETNRNKMMTWIRRLHFELSYPHFYNPYDYEPPKTRTGMPVTEFDKVLEQRISQWRMFTEENRIELEKILTDDELEKLANLNQFHAIELECEKDRLVLYVSKLDALDIKVHEILNSDDMERIKWLKNIFARFSVYGDTRIIREKDKDDEFLKSELSRIIEEKAEKLINNSRYTFSSIDIRENEIVEFQNYLYERLNEHLYTFTGKNRKEEQQFQKLFDQTEIDSFIVEYQKLMNQIDKQSGSGISKILSVENIEGYISNSLKFQLQDFIEKKKNEPRPLISMEDLKEYGEEQSIEEECEITSCDDHERAGKFVEYLRYQDETCYWYLILYAQGHSQKEIAQQIGVRQATITEAKKRFKKHRNAFFAKN